MRDDPRVMFVAIEWAEAHCVIPDGFRAGAPWRFYDWQLGNMAAFYTVRADAKWVPENPVLAPAFVYRRSLVVGPQKLGKSPGSAAHICVEGAGPAVFAGFAEADEGYVCAAHGCNCGWEYPYELGEPKGMPWPTPRIQLTAYSEDQTDNVYDALRPMIDNGPLHDLIPKTGEEFIRLPGGGRVDTVTSSDLSRIGHPTTFVLQTEVGLYTTPKMHRVARAQWRNVAGMGGRTAMESNAWDPAQKSVAQVEYESKAVDLYRYFVQPPKGLSYTNKSDRRKIHRAVYPDEVLRQHGGHTDLDAIEAEAASLIEHDPAEAFRFFGNGVVTGQGRAFDLDLWRPCARKTSWVPPDGDLIVIGFDGSKRKDHTSMIATHVEAGYQWPLGIWRPQDHKGEIPTAVVTAVLEQAMDTWDVWRLYGDPPYWEDTIAAWQGRWGQERIVEWWTNRNKPMAYAYRAWSEAQKTGAMSHCAESDEFCPLFTEHVGNAFRHDTGYRDAEGSLWYAEKEDKNSDNKIDSCPAAALSWEARIDAIAAGVLNVEAQGSVYDTDPGRILI